MCVCMCVHKEMFSVRACVHTGMYKLGEIIAPFVDIKELRREMQLLCCLPDMFTAVLQVSCDLFGSKMELRYNVPPMTRGLSML